MSIFIVAMLAVFLFLIAVYFYFDYRKTKREWRKEVQQFYLEGEKRKSVIVVIGAKFDETETAKEMEPKLTDANISFTPSEFIGALIVGYMGIVFVLITFFNLELRMALTHRLVAHRRRKKNFIHLKKKQKETDVYRPASGNLSRPCKFHSFRDDTQSRDPARYPGNR